jgi:hypothetical protein
MIPTSVNETPIPTATGARNRRKTTGISPNPGLS